MLHRGIRGSFLALTAFLLLAWFAPVAGGSALAKDNKKKKSWKGTLRVNGELKYDDNPFLLSAEQKDDLRTAGAAEEVSGRFRDMESVTDYILTPFLELEAEGPGVAGRELALGAEVGYHFYLRNTKRSHLEIDLSAEQATSKNGRLKIGFDYLPSYFQKNYLADATNLTDSVQADERVYRGGEYSEWDLTAQYRHRLTKGLSTRVGVGYLRRGYDAPFFGRNRNAPHAGLRVTIEPNRRWGIDFDYDLAAVDSLRGAEVLLLDEPAFGVDFNGDGDAADSNIRTRQLVDRTHTDQRFQVSTKFALGEATDLQVAYERRQRHFSSHEPFDIAHNGRTDERDTLEAEVSFRLAAGTRLRTGYRYVIQDTNRTGDPGRLGEITAYRRNGLHVGLRIRF